MEYVCRMDVKPLNAKLNPICHLPALLEAHHILHISRIKVNYANHWLSEICFRKVTVLGSYALLTGNLLRLAGSQHLHLHSQAVQAEWDLSSGTACPEDKAATFFQSVGNY